MVDVSPAQYEAAEPSDQQVARHQQVRMNRLGMSAVSYVLQLAIVGAICLLGPLEPRYFIGYVLSVLVIVLGFYAVFRRGWNLRLRHPSLTLPQVIAPALPGFVLLYQLDDAQSLAAILITAVVPLLYGVFGLSIRRFVVAGLVYGTGYVLMLVMHAYINGGDLWFRSNWILIISLSVVMAQIGLIGGFITHLRSELRERNQQLAEAMQQISAMAIRDDLTGLYNRRWLMDVLDKERQRLNRGEHSFSICLLDIDYFKHVNDEYGHGVGDRVLAGLAEEVDSAVRDVDTFGRLGGEEFLWIMPEAGLEQAREAAERIRQRIEALRFDNEKGGELSVSVSMGIAHNNTGNRQRSENLLRIADGALYEAKGNGRNRVVLASDCVFPVAANSADGTKSPVDEEAAE